jgi:hypothetical protein
MLKIKRFLEIFTAHLLIGFTTSYDNDYIACNFNYLLYETDVHKMMCRDGVYLLLNINFIILQHLKILYTITIESPSHSI